MKKLILTGCAAALFCIGSIAQVQDTVNNNLRQGAQETEQETKEAGNELRQGAEQTGDQIEQTADSAKQDAEQAGNEIKQETQEAGNEVRQGAERTGEQMEQATDSAQQDAERTKDQMDSSSQSSPSSNATDMGASAQPPMQEIEVLEDKEGPDNQVIYKYQGEFYYVDREQKQLVKIEESQLKDAEDKAIEHNAIMSGEEPAKSEQDKQ